MKRYLTKAGFTSAAAILRGGENGGWCLHQSA